VERNIHALERNPFDVAIIGGGIYGAAIAREAATRGLRTALIEKGDFCCGASANSLKIIHGGLRYLQQADIARLRESVRERRAMMRIAGHLVHPLPCMMPTLHKLMKSKPALLAGLLLNDLLSCDRNTLSDPDKRIPAGRIISKAECAGRVPGLDPAGITGGATWCDATAYNTERLVLGMVQSAFHDGNAAVANYVEAVGLHVEDDAVTGIEALDTLTGRRFRINARLVINAAGAWVNHIASLAGAGQVTLPAPALAMAMNVVLSRQLVADWAVGLVSPRTNHTPERLLFLLPWRKRTVAGTYYREHTGDPGRLEIRDTDIDAFLADLNRAYPAAQVTRGDVAFVHAGLLPMYAGLPAGTEPRLLHHYRMVDHGQRDALPGLLSVLGVKYTTARDVAERAIDRAAAILKRPVPPSTSARHPLPGGDIGHFRTFLADLQSRVPAFFTQETVQHLACNYGTAALALLEAANEDPFLLRPIHNDTDTLGIEVLHAVRQEMAHHVADIVFRRTDLASAGPPSRDAVAACARLMQRELGWDEEHLESEIDAVMQAVFPGQECTRTAGRA
jgi:glycerol-3-phosphate dehydrogenase